MRSRGSVLAITYTVGMLCAGWAFYHLYRNWKLSDNAVRTTATVMYLDTRVDRIRGEISKYHRVTEYSDECFKTVVYHTKGGEKIVWQSRVSVDMPDWMRPHSVYEEHAASILYDPEDPHYWEYDKVMSMFVNWFMLMLAGFGLMSLWFGPYDAIMKRLRETDEEREERLAPIRRDLYAPIETAKKPEVSKTPDIPETMLRSAPPGVDEDAPVPMLDDDVDEMPAADRELSEATAYTQYEQSSFDRDSGADGFDNTTDPFATMR